MTNSSDFSAVSPIIAVVAQKQVELEDACLLFRD